MGDRRGILALVRTRVSYVALALATILLGLGLHFRGTALGATAQDVLGDALWAAMMVWWVSAVAPAASLRTRALVALAICFVVEFSQLYHSILLDAGRSTTLGHLVLGSGFDPRDLLSYTLGVVVAVGLDLALVRRHKRAAVT